MRTVLMALPIALLAGCGSNEAATAEGAAAATAAPPPAASAPPAPTAGPVAIPGGAMSKEELGKAVCFYTPAELQKELGFAVKAGLADTARLEGYGMASCRYDGTENSVQLAAYWIDPAQVAAARQGMTMMSGGSMVEKLSGDPDSAYLHDQQDMGSSLHYLRRNIRIQVQTTSSRMPFATMKPRLLALRRVP